MARKPLKIERRKVSISRPSSGKRALASDFNMDAQLLGGLPRPFSSPENPDREAEQVLSDVEREIEANRAKSEALARLAWDEKFFCTLIFQTEEQKLMFLEHFGLFNTLEYDNFENMYLNGLEVSRRLGFVIEPIDLPGLRLRDNPKKYQGKTIPRKGGEKNGERPGNKGLPNEPR